ncbi:TadE/TadG family type IV pilus assembly protein [Microbacterium sp. gxy059]|uniref:TadE/TadG family type IV pilus assembly protein n=1 Tax=Microbacterium sp. gxy059 TaxID=2957199 RepID=UPI003D96BD38
MIDDERGSAPVEFVLVGALLTALTLAVLQLGLALYVRNVAQDAAVEGAHHAALADVDPQEGAALAERVITRTLGEGFARGARAELTDRAGAPSVTVRLTTTLPLAGLLGVPRGLEVVAHAPRESLD